jgi:hypothetical protein
VEGKIHMKKIAIGAAAAVTAAILTAAPAGATTQPDPAGFLKDVHNLGFPASADSASLDMGYGECDAHRRGTSMDTLDAQAAQTLAPKGYSTETATQFVAAALAALCPDEYQKELHKILDGHLTLNPDGSLGLS